MNNYTILTKRCGTHHVTLCDVFEDTELWELMNTGWRLIL